jgi:hypothetical protein
LELTRLGVELLVEDGFLTLEEDFIFDFAIELDFIFFEEELLEVLLLEDLLERTLVILPRVVLVFLGVVFVAVLGISLSSFLAFTPGFVI